MKISYMLKREDFYTINEKTLQEFFRQDTSTVKLFIYPHLNAIVKRNPSKTVKKYIYTEYNVSGSRIKKFLVWLYTRICLNTFGILASKTVTLHARIGNDVLIYPCNRKFRIFDFQKQTVSVVTKWGFPQQSLHNEINFRTHCLPADFILPIDQHDEKTYTEHIIDGVPLARIPRNEELKILALKLWQEYSCDSRISLKASDYEKQLRSRIETLTQRVIGEKPTVDANTLTTVCERFLKTVGNSQENIELIRSHGDLQPGNIWVENKTNKILIIDWETVETRSVWYDHAVLFDGIRNQECINTVASQCNLESAVVTLEEIIYRMSEVCELPHDYGTDNFNAIMKDLEKCCNV